MALRTTVLVSGVSNLHDARYCAGMGVAMIACPIGPEQAGALDAKKFAEIGGWLSGVELLGEIAGQVPENLSDFQVGALLTDSPMALSDQPEHILKIQLDELADRAQAEAMMERYQTSARYFLLESGKPWEMLPELRKWAAKFPILVGAHISDDTVVALLESVKPAGIALHPGQEIKTGLNDFGTLSEILEALEVDE